MAWHHLRLLTASPEIAKPLALVPGGHCGAAAADLSTDLQGLRWAQARTERNQRSPARLPRPAPGAAEREAADTERHSDVNLAGESLRLAHRSAGCLQHADFCGTAAGWSASHTQP